MGPRLGALEESVCTVVLVQQLHQYRRKGTNSREGTYLVGLQSVQGNVLANKYSNT